MSGLRSVIVQGRSLRASGDSKIAMSDGINVTNSPGCAGLSRNCAEARGGESESRRRHKIGAGRRFTYRSRPETKLVDKRHRRNREPIFPQVTRRRESPIGTKLAGFLLCPKVSQPEIAFEKNVAKNRT